MNKTHNEEDKRGNKKGVMKERKEIEQIVKVVGKNIRGVRVEKKISQEELASLADIHPTYLSRVENGSANISLERLIRLKIVLNVDFDRFFK